MEYQIQTNEKLKSLLKENEELKSKLAPTTKKIDREVSAIMLLEGCEKCEKSIKVRYSSYSSLFFFLLIYDELCYKLVL